jgi:hypothetical protein
VPIRIEPHQEEHSSSVAEFNRRMMPAKVGFDVPENPHGCWLPKIPGREIYQEIFLALDDRFVRGAYTFKSQEFSFRGDIRWVGSCQMPISEGLLDKRFSLVGPRLVGDALRREPLSYGLGMGSEERPLVKLFATLGWELRTIPFYFKVVHPFAFLRNITYARKTRAGRLMLDLLAYSGAGWAGLTAFRVIKSQAVSRSFCVEQVSQFAGWATDLWEECHEQYAMIGRRDAPVLQVLYPEEEKKFIRLRVTSGKRSVGWVVVLDTQMSESPYFGNLRVGSIVDCLAAPADAEAVTGAAVRFLEGRRVDLIVTNQSHSAWGRAHRAAGFLEGPSNYLFMSSVALSEVLREVDPSASELHLTRGDGDGPIHL